MKKAKHPTLDLHGFKTDDVYDAVDRFLLKHQNRKTVQIMTGKGKGLVQKTVIQYLKQAGYPWAYEKAADGKPNTGVLIIFME